MSQTQGSGEVNRRESLETWSFLCMVEGRGRLRPPFLPERKSRELLAEQARPDQCFRNLVARESRHVSSHEMGNSSTIRCQVIRGHTPDLYIRSFCLRVRGHASSLANIFSNFPSLPPSLPLSLSLSLCLSVSLSLSLMYTPLNKNFSLYHLLTLSPLQHKGPRNQESNHTPKYIHTNLYHNYCCPGPV